jgi:hypothetical protein
MEVRLLANTPRLLGPNRWSVDPAACGEKQAITCGAGPDGPKSEESSFSNKTWNFEYTKPLKICTRRFRSYIEMSIVPKIF